MKATKKLLALILAVCMLIGMPLSINVGATETEPLHIESVYIGEKGTADEDYLCIQFSEKASLQTRASTKLITLIVYDASGNKQGRMELVATSEASGEFPGASDANGLYKVRMVSSQGTGTYTSVRDWLEKKYLNNTAGARIVCNIADNFASDIKNDGWIQTFKGATSGTYLKNDNASYTLPDIGTEALVFDMSDNYNVSLQSVTRVDMNDFTLKFSEPVTLSGGGNFGLCVVKDGAIVSTKNLTVGSWRGKTAGSTYTDTWQLGFHHTSYHISLNTAIASFVANEYTDALKAAGAQVCFYIKDQADNRINGRIDTVYTNGNTKQLKNDASITSAGNRETYFVPVNVEDLFFQPTAYVATKDEIFVEINGQYSSAWTNNTYLSAFDSNGNLLKEHKLELVRNYKNGTESTATTINVALWFGANSTVNYETFVADVERANPGVAYELKLAVKETAAITSGDNTLPNLGNGVVDTLIHYNTTTFKADAVLKADQSVAGTSDIGYIPFGEIAGVESVEVYDNSKVIVTFSHDIDLDKMLALNAAANGQDFYLGISAVGVNDLVGYDANQDAVVVGGWCDQANIYDLERYGEGNNAVIGTLKTNDYLTMLKNFEALKASGYNNPNNLEYAIRFRIEMENGTAAAGQFPLCYNIDPLEEGVLSPFITTGTRIWTDVTIVEPEDSVISINGVKTDDLSIITNAPAGSSVILVKDAVIEQDGFIVPAGVTLDLNGKTITLNANTGIDVKGVIADNTDGGALIRVVDKDTAALVIAGTNPQMLLYDAEAGGYRLFNKEFSSKGYRGGTAENAEDANAMRYGIHLHFDNAKAYELLAQGGTDMALTMALYTESGSLNVPCYAFKASTLKKYGEACLAATDAETLAKKTIVLTVSGLNLLNGEALKVDASLNFMDTVTTGFVAIAD